MSFKVSEFFVCPETCLSTELPFKSKIYLSCSTSYSYRVFSISRTYTLSTLNVSIVNTPKILANKLSGLLMKC